MVTNQEKVSGLIKGFVDSEKAQRLTSSIRIRNLTARGETQLDTLARLLTNKDGENQDICIAVFLKKNGQLLVASNLEEPRYAKDYIGDLKNYIIASSGISHDRAYKQLVKRAIQQIYFFIVANSYKRTSGIKLKKLEDFKLLIEELQDCRLISEQQLKELREKMREVFQELKEKKVEGWQWDYIFPLIDTDAISNAIRDEVFDQGVIEAIKGRKICYIKDKFNMHAEMKILNKLYHRENQRFFEVGYIGITKLCCFPCHTMIYLVNSKMSSDSFFYVCGTHASTYFGWIIPNFYQEEFIENLKRLKKWESSSDMPRELPLDPCGEFQRSWVSIHKGFRDKDIKDRWSEKFSWSELKVWFKEMEFSPESDFDLVLWMRDKKIINAVEAARERLSKWKREYQVYQQNELAQNLKYQVQISLD